MPDERVGMDDPAMRLSHWLAGTEPPHYNPRNDVRAVLSEITRLRRRVPEREAMLEEFWVAFNEVERGVVDFDLHADAVERMRAADEALR